MKDKENKKPLPDKATAEEMRKEYDFSKARKNPYIKKNNLCTAWLSRWAVFILRSPSLYRCLDTAF